MEILLFLAGLLALAGIWLIFDFSLWYFTGHVVPARIESFEKGLPVLSFETIEGEKARVKAASITHIGYLLAKPQTGDIFNSIYRTITGDEIIVRVHGFLYLITGLLALIPLLGVLALKYSNALMINQLMYLLILIAMTLGGWVALKLISRNY
jgi:hypothetical protein